MADRPPGLQRVFIDYDSTLNPGQGSCPIAADRAALLSRYLARWSGAGVDLYVLTASNPDKKVAALEAASLRQNFKDVLSSTMPEKFATKGDLIAQRIHMEGWEPAEQLLADDSIEAIKSVWQDADENPRQHHLAHTLRLPEHSRVGLTEDDLGLIDGMIFTGRGAGAGKECGTTHRYSASHGGARFVDATDSVMKCELDSLGVEARGDIINANPPEKQREWIEGRPDLAALVGSRSLGAGAAPSGEDPPMGRVRTEDMTKDQLIHRIRDLEAFKARFAEANRVEAAPPTATAAKEEGQAEPLQMNLAQALLNRDDQGKGKKGKPSSKEPPKSGPPPPVGTEEKPEIGEGSTVTVSCGAHAGARGVVRKVAGEGTGARWRVELDSGNSTWVDVVQLADGAAGGLAAIEEDSVVEVAAGVHCGKRGTVIRITGEGKETRWRVQLEAGPSTWVDEVRALSPSSRADASLASPASAPAAAPPAAPGAAPAAALRRQPRRRLGRVSPAAAAGAAAGAVGAAAAPAASSAAVQAPKATAPPASAAGAAGAAGLPPQLTAMIAAAGGAAKGSFGARGGGGAGGAAASAGGVGGSAGSGADGVKEGAQVEVAAGTHAGTHAGERGTVLKVLGQGGGRRWLVQLASGASTWADAVTAIGPPFGPPPRREPTRKAKSFGCPSPPTSDTDPEMPELLPAAPGMKAPPGREGRRIGDDVLVLF